MDSGVKGPSKGELYRRRVQQNRARMVEAATTLFVTNGYAGTTMAAVAAAAGMSVQNVYFTFGTKADLLQAAFDHAALGAYEKVPPTSTDWYRAAAEDPSPHTALAAFVTGNCEILRGTAPLTLVAEAAARSDPTVARLHRHNEALRMSVMADMVHELERKRPFRAGLGRREAVDIVFSLISPQLYTILTVSREWHHTAFVRWVTAAARHELWG